MFTLGFKCSRIALTALFILASFGLANAQQRLAVQLVHNPPNIVSGIAKTDQGKLGVSYTVWLEWSQPAGIKRYEVLENNTPVQQDTFAEPAPARTQQTNVQFATSGIHQYDVKIYDERNRLVAQGSLPQVTIPAGALERPQTGGPGTSIIDYFSPDISPLAGDRKFTNLGEYLFQFIKQAMILAVVAATLMVVYAGFTYLNSGGSPEATAQAKGMIQGALLGLATIFLMAAFLVSLIKIEPFNPSTPTSAPQSGGSPTSLAAAQREALVKQGQTEARTVLQRALELGSITVQQLKTYNCSQLLRPVAQQTQEIDEAFNQGVIQGCDAFKRERGG